MQQSKTHNYDESSKPDFSPNAEFDLHDFAIGIDLGGVLLTDGLRSTFLAIDTALGRRSGTTRTLWQQDIQLPAYLGQITATKAMRRLGGSPEGAVIAETLLLSAFQPIPYGVEALHRLSASGATLILATNHIDGWTPHWHQIFPWFSLFDGICDSSVIHKMKPDPAYYTILRRFAPTQRWAFIDDTPKNVEAAVRAGMIGVRGTGKWFPSLLEDIRQP